MPNRAQLDQIREDAPEKSFLLAAENKTCDGWNVCYDVDALGEDIADKFLVVCETHGERKGFDDKEAAFRSLNQEKAWCGECKETANAAK